MNPVAEAIAHLESQARTPPGRDTASRRQSLADFGFDLRCST
jgi:hypothetical protein